MSSMVPDAELMAAGVAGDGSQGDGVRTQRSAWQQ